MSRLIHVTTDDACSNASAMNLAAGSPMNGMSGPERSRRSPAHHRARKAQTVAEGHIPILKEEN